MQRPLLLRLLFLLILAAALVALSWGSAQARDYLTNKPPLLERLTPEVVAAIWGEADHIERVDDDGPAAAAVYQDGELVGYLFSTLDVLQARGYTTTPFDVVAGVDLEGQITGAAELYNREPFIHNDTRRTRLLEEFMVLIRVEGMVARVSASDGPHPNYVSGATISSRAMRSAVREGGSMVLRFRHGLPEVTEPALDMANFTRKTRDQLIEEGAIIAKRVTNADVEAALEAAGASDLTPIVATRGGPDDTYIEFRAGLAMPPSIGRNMAGPDWYERMFSDHPPGAIGLIFGSDGAYDFRGFRLQLAKNDFQLERISVVQDGETYNFRRSDILSIKATMGRTSHILMLAPDSGFDPLRPWTAELYILARARPDSEPERIRIAAADYELPPQYILLPQPAPRPAWLEAWDGSRTETIIMGGALGLLTLILAFQHSWTTSRQVHRWLRNGFLVFTLVWIGWIAGAQLSIVHILNYMQAPFENMGLAFYMAEPLIVMVAIYTAISLIILGRGVFCGWLCPFGAFQELTAKIGRFFKLPQWNPSEAVQKRLWMGKYISLGVIVALTFTIPAVGAFATEVEPFKTAITAKFERPWPYVLYAAILLGIGLLTERAFCRFLCPLGGALAILDRLHLVNLLNRRPECGNPCSLCERACPVRAIEKSGKIKMAECFQCLDCQVEYHDDRRCPPLARQRKMLEPAAKQAKNQAIHPVSVAIAATAAQ